MKKSLYKSLVPKGLSVAILSASLISNQVLTIFASESSESAISSQEIIDETAVLETPQEENYMDESHEETISEESLSEETTLEESPVEQNPEESMPEETHLEEYIESNDESFEGLDSEIESTETNDTTPPRLLSYSTDKTHYQTGETIYLTVVTDEETDIEFTEVILFDKETNGTDSMHFANSKLESWRNEEGNLVSTIELKVPTHRASGEFYIEVLVLADSLGNGEIYYPQIEIDHNIEIMIENPGVVDSTPPKLISYQTDKKEYLSGENLKLTLEVEEEFDLSEIYVNLYHENLYYFSPINFIDSEAQIERISNGNYLITLDKKLTLEQALGTYNLSSIYLSDGSRNYVRYDFEENTDLPSLSINLNYNNGIITPKIIDISTSQSIYQVNEQVQLIIELETDIAIYSAQAWFTNTEEFGNGLFNFTNLEYYPTIEQISESRYIIKMYLDLPANMPSASYYLDWLEIRDLYGNIVKYQVTTISEDQQINIDIENPNVTDNQRPKVVNYLFNKTEYLPGEVIRLHIEIEEESELEYLYAVFVTGEGEKAIGYEMIDFDPSPIRNINGNYEITLNYIVPIDFTPATYTLKNISIRDVHYYHGDTETNLQFQVLPDPIEEIFIQAEAEEEQANPEFNTVVNLIDQETGELVTKFGFKGDEYDTRLASYLTQYNRVNGLDYSLENSELIDTKISELNIQYIYNAYIINLSEEPALIEEEPALFPQGIIYSPVETEEITKKVQVIYNDQVLLEEEEYNTDSIDESIRQALSQLESDEYYFNTVDVSYGSPQPMHRMMRMAAMTVVDPAMNIEIKVAKRPVYEALTEDSSIDFDIQYVESEELLIDQEETVQEGKEGTLQTTYRIGKVDGEEISRQKISEEVTIKPINQIIAKGVKEIEEESITTEIPYTTERIDSSDLLVGQEEISQKGEVGELVTTYKVTYIRGKEIKREEISNQTSKEPVTEKILVGTKEIKTIVETEDIEFETEFIESADLLLGETKEVTAGVNGIKEINYKVTYIQGKETEREKIGSKVTVEPINRVVHRGIKEVKTETEKTSIPFKIEEIENVDLLVGEEEITQKGQEGDLTTTYDVTYIRGEETSREKVSEEITKEPVTQIVQVGIKEVKEKVKTEVIPHEIERVDNPDMLVGEEKITQEGVDGERTITENIYFVHGKEVDRQETASAVTLEPISQIIEKGIRQVKEETKTEVVPFEIERVDNPDMLVGDEKIVQEGVDGERTITENVYFVHGEEVDRQEISNEITLDPIKQIIEVGVKEIKVEDITEPIEFETEFIDNADWLEGTQEILTPGANGEVLVTYEITYINGVESARKELNRVILVDPTTQVIEKGTKEAPKPAEVEQNTPGKDQPAKATLPETGEQGSHAIFTAASLAILAGLGLVVGGRKKEEE